MRVLFALEQSFSLYQTRSELSVSQWNATKRYTCERVQEHMSRRSMLESHVLEENSIFTVVLTSGYDQQVEGRIKRCRGSRARCNVYWTPLMRNIKQTA